MLKYTHAIQIQVNITYTMHYNNEQWSMFRVCMKFENKFYQNVVLISIKMLEFCLKFFHAYSLIPNCSGAFHTKSSVKLVQRTSIPKFMNQWMPIAYSLTETHVIHILVPEALSFN